MWSVATWLVASFVLGFMDAFREVSQEAEQNFIKRLDELLHRVREEKEGDVIYWYDHDDGEFLAQGRTQEDIIQVVKTRYPNHMFYLDTNIIIGKPTWEPRPLTSLTNKS